jgi:acetyltransferase-like isoleucine patch superfamily enzyme
MESIEIGEGTICGENVKIYDHNHEYRDIRIPIKEQGYHSAPIRIGKHCWIASNVVILQGVTIGDNCVIGAGCVIYKDIEKNSVVVNKQDLLIQNLK